MKLSTFLNDIKLTTMQNVASDFYSDSTWVQKINEGLYYIYNYMAAKGIWYYSAYEETISADDATQKVFTATYNILGLIPDHNPLDSGNYNTSPEMQTRREVDHGVRGNGTTILTQKPFFLLDDSQNFYLTGDKTGISQIKTGKAYSTLKVRYHRGPTIASIESTGSDIDLPEQLIGALHNICMRQIMPVYLEQGANLAQYHIRQATEHLENYCKVIYGSIGQQSLTS